MDPRDFLFKTSLEYEDIAILDGEGTVFYISQEEEKSHVIFVKGTPPEYWFKEEEHPTAFIGFRKLYKELGEINYKLYGIRKPDGSIYFFDLKVDFTKNFYHSDFKKLCNECSIPMCQEYFIGNYSLKTLKKLINRTGKKVTDLFFKPIQENDFGIPKVEKKSKEKKVVPAKEEKLSFKNKESILNLVIEKFTYPDLFNSLDEYDVNSLLEYTKLFCSHGFRKNYREILTQDMIDMVPLNRFLIIDYLCKEIAIAIVDLALKYEDETYKDNIYESVKPYTKDMIFDIEKDIRPDIVLMVDEMLKEKIN